MQNLLSKTASLLITGWLLAGCSDSSNPVSMDPGSISTGSPLQSDPNRISVWSDDVVAARLYLPTLEQVIQSDMTNTPAIATIDSPTATPEELTLLRALTATALPANTTFPQCDGKKDRDLFTLLITLTDGTERQFVQSQPCGISIGSGFFQQPLNGVIPIESLCRLGRMYGALGARCPLGDDVDFDNLKRDIWGSDTTYPPSGSSFNVFRDEASLLAFDQEKNSNCCTSDRSPAIDFDKSIVLYATSGSQSAGGYTIDVSRISILDDELLVEIIHTVPGSTCITTQALTNPYQYVIIHSRATKVTIHETVHTSVCE